MKIFQITFVILVGFSLIFTGEVEAKHRNEKALSRVLKEISERSSSKN